VRARALPLVLAAGAAVALALTGAGPAGADPADAGPVAAAAPGSSAPVPAATSLATDAQRAPAAAGGGPSRTLAASSATTGPHVALRGRGFGHGRGMSQWGARGMAAQGKTVDEVLTFYYPGTEQASDLGNPDVRVRISAAGTSGGAGMPVVRESGLTATAGACTDPLDVPGAVRWRAVPSGRWKLQYWPQGGFSNAWKDHASPCSEALRTAEHVSFAGADGTTTLYLPGTATTRDYRGALRTVPSDPWLVNFYDTINVVPMDDYLRSVVPAEMPASWEVEALKAQAVAARSYAAARLGGSGTYDLCDTMACQVYPGLSSTTTPEHPSSTAAVLATSGLVLRYGGAVAVAEFGSTNGGQTAAGSKAYQVSKPDPYDGHFAEAPDTWAWGSQQVSEIESTWPAIGTFRELRATRDGNGAWYGGRVATLRLVGTHGSVDVGGEDFALRLNLRSSYFTTEGSSVGTDFRANAFSDLIARDGTGALWTYPGNGRGGWLPRTAVATGWKGALEVLAPGDWDGDGRADLMARSSSGSLVLHRGDGAGGVIGQRVVGSGWQKFNAVVAPGDLDGDGHADLLARDKAGTLWLYRGDGTGGWLGGGKGVSKGAGWGGLRELEAVGDVDGVAGTELVGVKSTGELYLLRFSASGTYLGAVKAGTGWQAYSALTGAGDLDGDGRADLVARDSSGRLWNYPGNGSGRFLPRVQLGSGWSSFTIGS
jgi:SpoIID/LytB domain protein